MKQPVVIAFAFMLVELLGIRGYIAVAYYLIIRKKEKKRYKTETSKFDRWFMISAHKYVLNRYSKYEKRFIRYVTVVKCYRGIIIIAHLLLAIMFLLCVLYHFEVIGHLVINSFFILYSLVILISFVLLALINFYCQKRYHCSRYKK